MDFKCCRAKEFLEAHGYTVLSPKRNKRDQNWETPKELSRLSLGTVAHCDELIDSGSNPYIPVHHDGKPIPLIVGRCGMCGAELRLKSKYSLYISDKYAGLLCEKCGEGSLSEIYERVSKKFVDGGAELGR